MKSPKIWLTIIILVVVTSGCVSYTQEKQVFSAQDSIIRESGESIAHQQMEEVMPQNLISAEIQPLPKQEKQAALALQNLGFQVLQVGTTISVQAPRSLWESTFNVSFKEEKKTAMAEIESERIYLRAVTDKFIIPQKLESLISEVMFIEPPEFF